MKHPRLRYLHTGERGQAIILLVGLITFMFAIAAIAVDFGIWMSERQGAHKDADAAALAGAFELFDQDFVNPANNNDAATKAAAEQAALDWADRNGVPAEDVHNLVADNESCFGFSPVIDSVSLDAEHHSKALFASIFGITAPEIGAHARACLGSIISAEGLLPLGVQIEGAESDCWEDIDGDTTEDPLFGQECVLGFGGGDLTSGEAGHLKLYNDDGFDCSGTNTGGGDEFRDEIRQGGANTTCYVLPPGETCDSFQQGCVYPSEGGVGGSTHQAFEDLVAGEGECDAASWGNGNGTDEFLETVEAANGDPSPSPDTLFAELDCESPRLVSLIIIEQFDEQGNAPRPIIAFAGFFITGCESEDGTQFSSTCEMSGRVGQARIKGFFVNILVTGGDIGAINKWTPKAIALTE